MPLSASWVIHDRTFGMSYVVGKDYYLLCLSSASASWISLLSIPCFWEILSVAIPSIAWAKSYPGLYWLGRSRYCFELMKPDLQHTDGTLAPEAEPVEDQEVKVKVGYIFSKYEKYPGASRRWSEGEYWKILKDTVSDLSVRNVGFSRLSP